MLPSQLAHAAVLRPPCLTFARAIASILPDMPERATTLTFLDSLEKDDLK